MKPTLRCPQWQVAVLLSYCLLLMAAPPFRVGAQTPCPGGTPASNGPLTAWAQNSIVSVNVNSSQFTQAEFDNCIKPVFDNFNLQNGATQGNWSGVRFSVTYSTSTVAVVNSSQADNVSGVTYGFQVNKGAPSNVAGETFRSNNGTHRDSAVTNLNSGYNINNCAAMRQTMAHEIGHTLGLGDCPTCTAGSSIMTPATSLNDATSGADSPTTCDNSVIRTSAGYSQGTLSQPADPGGGSGGGSCPPEPPVPCPDTHIWDPCMGQCVRDISPVVVDVNGDGFSLTSAENGVSFDINGDGRPDRLSWTSGGSDDAWLALDRNGDGTINSGQELFGNFTPQPPPPPEGSKHGFLALAVYDRPDNGGNGDGLISAQDSIFDHLLLWQDTNHDGVSEASELHGLRDLGLQSIALDYKLSRRVDEHGNRFRYRAKVEDRRGQQLGRWAWDVFLLRAP